MQHFTNAIKTIQKIANEFTGALSIKNAKREYIYANDYWLKSVDIPKTLVLGKTDDEILSEENARIALEMDTAAFEKKTPMEYSKEIELNGKKLKYITIKWVICNDAGEPYCLCTLADFFENKENVLALRDTIDSVFQTV